MPIKKWILQYLVILPVVFLLLAGVQYLKGRSLLYAVEFGLLWAVVSIGIFALRRYYNYRKNVHCVVCNDLSEKDLKSDDK